MLIQKSIHHPLYALLLERVTSGLRRESITRCSEWATMYRIMGEPFPGKYDFCHHPWCRDMHDCEADVIVGQKAAQMGFTEVALNKAFYNIDILGRSVLYVLPAGKPDASDFSTSRFDAALDLSDHLRKLFSDTKNVGHKRAGSANFFLRGSRSRSSLKSIPVSLVIADEIDEFVKENIPLLQERMSGQVEKQFFTISTPTIANEGINAYFKDSTQHEFYFNCPHCSRLTTLIYPDCLVIAGDHVADPRVKHSHLRCKECKAKLDHESKIDWLKNGQWLPTYSDRDIVGFHISQLYSMTRPPAELASVYLKGLSDVAAEQEFFNSKLGVVHEPKGARVLESDITNCMGGFRKKDTASGLVTMGVDPGNFLHYEIDKWTIEHADTADINLTAQCQLIAEGKVKDFEELDVLMHQYGVLFCVIDANPERRKAVEFAQRFWGRVKLCIYARGITTKQLHVHADEDHLVSVDRTSWLDLSLGRFRTRRITLPIDISYEYRQHIQAPVRLTRPDKDGNPVASYVKAARDEDHLAHARNYAEIALPLGVSLAQNQDIKNVY